ncbi:hypothetical protein [Pigmentiphaga litoralis]|uniref:SPOR domain-containing protein n=1 Tax=Pigmentiphaga litoralis TaxID=516702 RepID=A0A7Y9LMS1_9BURK|nr:hypothetical protein [Pigmentiphaga litoralis]NYE24410.1 hypothetical protein [Pigmentiphaga litoralis]NYE81976.1 hypothetical protein [Pigmentiphaga litoralis]
MRSVFVVLLLANLALFGIGHGWFGQAKSQRGREPARLNQQIREEAIEVPRMPGVNETGPRSSESATPAAPTTASSATAAPAGGTAAAAGSGAAAVLVPAIGPQAASTPATPTPATPAANAALACLEWGSFTDAELPAAQRWAEERLTGARAEIRRIGDRPNWMVIVPAFADADAAQAAAIQLNRRGVKDLFVIQEAGPYQNAISLGVFRNEDSAHRQVDMLQGQGVRNAKVVTRPGGIIRSWLVVRNATADQQQALQAARATFTRQNVGSC